MSSRPAPRRVLPRSPFQRGATPDPEPTQWVQGERVCHDARGVGTILDVRGDVVTIDFGSGDVCKVSATSKKLAHL